VGSYSLTEVARDAESMPAFLVLGHERRRLLWFAVTRNPTADWLARQITEAFPWDGAPKDLIRDNDRVFGAVFKAHVRAMGIRDRPMPRRSGVSARRLSLNSLGRVVWKVGTAISPDDRS
jgi:hypothetical protein